MQTFLPYADFEKSARCIDYRRLGKQRCEALQIYNIITGNAISRAWISHPCVCMWRGYPEALAAYMNACIQEWIKRGYVNNMEIIEVSSDYKKPSWIGDKDFHKSHQAALLFKNIEYYKKFKWEVKPAYNYIWPQGDNNVLL